MRPPPKLNHEGLPIDPDDWTYEDWRDLHFGILAIKARIAARHKPQTEDKPNEPDRTPHRD